MAEVAGCDAESVASELVDVEASDFAVDASDSCWCVDLADVLCDSGLEGSGAFPYSADYSLAVSYCDLCCGGELGADSADAYGAFLSRAPRSVYFACFISCELGIGLDLSLVDYLFVVTDWCRELLSVCSLGLPLRVR